MKYSKFQQLVEGYVKKSGITQSVRYSFDADKQMYIARIDGLMITGCSISNKITVNLNGRKFMI